MIIGVEDKAGALTPVGLSETDLATWNYDHISDGLRDFVDPSVSFELDAKQFEGKQYIVLTVQEFADVPILCIKQAGSSGRVVLKKGACYVRSRSKPETAEVSTQEDMRDLLDLAAEKRLQRVLQQVQRAGATLVPLPSTRTPLVETRSDQELFDAQLGELA